jgi:hypothetical protein
VIRISTLRFNDKNCLRTHFLFSFGLDLLYFCFDRNWELGSSSLATQAFQHQPAKRNASINGGKQTVGVAC